MGILPSQVNGTVAHMMACTCFADQVVRCRTAFSSQPPIHIRQVLRKNTNRSSFQARLSFLTGAASHIPSRGGRNVNVRPEHWAGVITKRFSSPSMSSEDQVRTVQGTLKRTHHAQIICEGNYTAFPTRENHCYCGVKSAHYAKNTSLKDTKFTPTRMHSHVSRRTMATSECSSLQERAHQLRKLMRTVPHPVVVITASKKCSAPLSSTEHWLGATVSSFNTVTLTPELLVSFNIKKKSSTFEAIAESGYFGVNALSDTLGGKLLAAKFTKGNHPSPFATLAEPKEGHCFTAGISWEALTSDPPVSNTVALPPIISSLSGDHPEATAFSLLCQLKQAVIAGDHMVVIGRVFRTSISPSWAALIADKGHGQCDVGSASRCLTYHDGAYSSDENGA